MRFAQPTAVLFNNNPIAANNNRHEASAENDNTQSHRPQQRPLPNTHDFGDYAALSRNLTAAESDSSVVVCVDTNGGAVSFTKLLHQHTDVGGISAKTPTTTNGNEIVLHDSWQVNAQHILRQEWSDFQMLIYMRIF